MPKAKRVLTPEQKVAAKIRWRAWADLNRKKLNKNVREYRRRRSLREGCWRDEGPKAVALKAWMIELKSKPCTDCGHKFPVCCMDFDHREPAKKKFNVGSMFAHHYARELIELEIRKCDLVCANCHRIRTRDQKQGKNRTALKNMKIENDDDGAKSADLCRLAAAGGLP